MASALGLITANSPISDNYFSTLDFKLSLGADWYLIELSILKVINYLLMSIFFFVVGLEIKRELTSGHLASFKKALLPFIAAIGGMAVPALIYLAIAGGAGVESTLIYSLFAFTLWFCLYKTGVHPTLAGVILGLMTPNIVRKRTRVEDIEDGSVSVIEWLEHKFHPISTFFVVPVFAFANTGVVITAESIKDASQSVIAWGIFVGLVIGKPLGVLIASIAAKRSKLAEFPEGATNSSILATGSAAGIGFTVAIFIANLAFDDAQTQDIAVLAVIVASVVSALISLTLFKLLARK